ncbi:MAG: hypothetical protein HZA50_09250 [Planctomycetes bacterium]|nr:hypothetical protein [Planctomycetota bacterium]
MDFFWSSLAWPDCFFDRPCEALPIDLDAFDVDSLPGDFSPLCSRFSMAWASSSVFSLFLSWSVFCLSCGVLAISSRRGFNWASLCLFFSRASRAFFCCSAAEGLFCSLSFSAAFCMCSDACLTSCCFWSLGLPSLGLPSLGLPSLGLPSLGLPSLGLPSLGLPSLGLPSLGLPSLGLPSLGLPSLGLPSLGLPSLGLPSLGLPSLGLPSGLSPRPVCSVNFLISSARATALSFRSFCSLANSPAFVLAAALSIASLKARSAFLRFSRAESWSFMPGSLLDMDSDACFISSPAFLVLLAADDTAFSSPWPLLTASATLGSLAAWSIFSASVPASSESFFCGSLITGRF